MCVPFSKVITGEDVLRHFLEAHVRNGTLLIKTSGEKVINFSLLTTIQLATF